MQTLFAILVVVVAQANPVEVGAVLDWDLSCPPPLTYADVERIVTAAIEADPDMPPMKKQKLVFRRGIVRFYTSPEKHLLSTADFEESLQISPGDVVAESYRIASQTEVPSNVRERDFEQREREAVALVRRFPNSPHARWALGAVLSQKPNPDCRKALYQFTQCARLDPSFRGGYVMKTFIYQSLLHDYDACIENAKLASQIHIGPEARLAARMQFTIAITFAERRDFEAAIPLLCETTHILFDLGSVKFFLWMCLSGAGRSSAAECVADELIKLSPNRPNAYAAKAISLALRGEHDAAAQTAGEIQRLKLECPVLLKKWLAARLADAAGDRSTAARAYSEAVLDEAHDTRAFRTDAELRLALIRAAAPEKSIRDGVAAVRLMRKLLQELDESVVRQTSQLVLACGYAEMGNFQGAIEAIDEAAAARDLPAEEMSRYSKMKEMFKSRRPYRLDAKKPADRLLEIPAVACYYGPLKKIDLADDHTLKLPDE